MPLAADQLETTLLVLSIVAATGALVRGTWMVYRKVDAVLALTAETHRATTVNGNKSQPPTIPDKLSEVATELRHLNEQISQQREALDGVQQWVDEHGAWSTAEVHRLWSYILDAERRGSI